MSRLHVAFLCLSLVACELTKIPEPQKESSAPAPQAYKEADEAVLKLLGGLKKGDALGGVQVTAVSAVVQGRIFIQLSKDNAVGEVVLTKQDENGPLPPAKSQKYAIFFSTPSPKVPSISQGQLTAVCEALVERLRATEDTVPSPEGLKSYGNPQPM